MAAVADPVDPALGDPFIRAECSRLRRFTGSGFYQKWPRTPG